MQKIKAKNLILLLIITAILSATTTASFATIDPMYIGVGARPLGMGKAYVAVAEDGDTVFMNPAGLGRIYGWKLTSMYATLLGDIRYVVLGGAYPLEVGTLGGGIVSSNVSEIALYDSSFTPLGVGDYGNSVFFLSYGLDVGKTPALGMLSDWGKDVQFGASLKYFAQGGSGASVEAGTGSGIDMDLGFLYTPLPWLSFGYTQTNFLPTEVAFSSGINEQIPSIAKIGTKVALIGPSALYQFDALYGKGQQKLNLAIDYDISCDDAVGGAGHIGVEYYPIKYLALRLGADQNPGPDGTVTDMTAGIGLRYDGLEFNYAYHPYDGIQENTTHFFSISYVGPEDVEAPKKAEMKVNIIEPADKTIVKDKTIDVAGNVEGYKTSFVTNVNDMPVEVSSNEGTFKTILKFKSFGKMLVRATVTDPETGNSSTAKARLVRLVSFNDVTGDYWSREPIEYCGTTGLVEGYPDGTFRPERALSRAELATLLVRAKGVELPQIDKSVFPDLSKTHWAARYVAAAVDMGLVKGYPDGTFRPNDKINRAEGVLVLARFEGLREPEEKLETGPYTDVPVKHWASGMISAAKDAEFLDYIKSDTFGVKEDLPRSEAIYILAKTTFGKKKIEWLLNWDVGFDDTEKAEPGEATLKSFKDIPDGYWAERPIRELATANIISGFPDGTFKPEKTLTRAELSTLLVKARGMELPVLDSPPFGDVPLKNWASRYIKVANDLGLVQGYPDGSFRPGKSVNRAEAITVIDRFDGVEIPETIMERPFPDVPESNWASRFISAGLNAGILDYLKGKNFEPGREMTRAEAAEMISKTKFGKGKIEELNVGEEQKGPTGIYKIRYSMEGKQKEEKIIVE